MTTYTITEAQRQQLLDLAMPVVSTPNRIALKLLQSLTPNSGEAVSIDAALIEAIEDSVCMGHDAWDLIDPIELVKAVISCTHTAPSTNRDELVEVYAKLAESELRANQLEAQFNSQCRITVAALEERAKLAAPITKPAESVRDQLTEILDKWKSGAVNSGETISAVFDLRARLSAAPQGETK